MSLQFRDTKFGRLSVGDIICVTTKRGYMGLARIDSFSSDRDECLEKIVFHWLDQVGTLKTSEFLDDFIKRMSLCDVIARISSEDEWINIMKMYKKHMTIFQNFIKASSCSSEVRNKSKRV